MVLNPKTYFSINEKTLLNILDTFLCKIMKRELKCIFKLCAAILQDLKHPKNRPPISLSHTIECMWERRASMFPVLDTNLCSLLHTSDLQKLSRIEKHKILKCVCLSSFWIGCAKKDRKIYPLNLSILQQITVNGVNFCTAYVFGRLDDRSLVFSILWLSPKIIAFHPKVASLKWKERKKHT